MEKQEDKDNSQAKSGLNMEINAFNYYFEELSHLYYIFKYMINLSYMF